MIRRRRQQQMAPARLMVLIRAVRPEVPVRPEVLPAAAPRTWLARGASRARRGFGGRGQATATRVVRPTYRHRDNLRNNSCSRRTKRKPCSSSCRATHWLVAAPRTTTTTAAAMTQTCGSSRCPPPSPAAAAAASASTAPTARPTTIATPTSATVCAVTDRDSASRRTGTPRARCQHRPASSQRVGPPTAPSRPRHPLRLLRLHWVLRLLLRRPLRLPRLLFRLLRLLRLFRLPRLLPLRPLQPLCWLRLLRLCLLLPVWSLWPFPLRPFPRLRPSRQLRRHRRR